MLSHQPELLIDIEESAQRFLKRKGHIGFELTLKTSGCSGYAYELKGLSHLDESCPTYQTVVMYDILFRVDPHQISMLNGTRITCSKDTMGLMTLHIRHPHAQAKCGCGKSFYMNASEFS